ncbi:RNA polymerase sigma-70 factor (ECF subfamily) [Silvibacterium bohemicum]|uniref:RNA polymerase sigma-70 factor (ECF subfamily) n=1 Tax=Silvibacterium bohemicum TaxID=1577686 RepID=A0A841K5D1_9BACT|nr:sigma-70 family RNA polymerase sigma factor [Silvibacterium bohemicum]MBB6145484.1 RNA polymerase sigma-70 factor (ECF subfamily) [Silvibacterium bohemicum]
MDSSICSDGNVTASFSHHLRFRNLMLEHQSMVFSIALRILGDRSAAEETAQDVFLELHAKLGELEEDQHVLHWLRRVAVHRAIDLLRRRKRRPEVQMDWSELPEIPDRQPAPVDDDPPLSAQLQQLIGSLPAVPRSVLILRYQEDMSPDEIGSALNMPVATVKSHLQRSLRLLREKAARVVRQS